jgi:hypothetical protein
LRFSEIGDFLNNDEFRVLLLELVTRLLVIMLLFEIMVEWWFWYENVVMDIFIIIMKKVSDMRFCEGTWVPLENVWEMDTLIIVV